MATLSPEDSLRAHLIADASLSPTMGQRWHHGVIPRTSHAPAGRFFRVDGEQLITHQGTAGPGNIKLHCEVWAKDIEQAKALEALAKASVLAVPSNSRLGGMDGVRIGYCEIQDLRDLYSPTEKLFGRAFLLYFDFWP